MKIAILNNAVVNPNFGETDVSNRHFKERCYFLVADDYDFVTNLATEITGVEFTTWQKVLLSYGRVEIGSEPIRSEKNLIGTRKRDGISAYQQTQAELRLSRLANGIDHDVYKTSIYDPMKKVIKEVESGDWINAYEEVNIVVSNAILTPEMISGFRLQISEYLLNAVLPNGTKLYPEYELWQMDASGILIAP